ncbi:hypothetical protein [Actinoplanes sp. NPDC026619]|uniref:hypothetical protein n=1 Tax=Actinoplanes sp. NPDC026619 TaxID=3155798 RepID=UPI0033C3ADD1
MPHRAGRHIRAGAYLAYVGGRSTGAARRPMTRGRPARMLTAMRPKTRKLWLVLHVLSSSAWIGIDVLVAVLVAVRLLAGSPARRGLAYQALGTFVWWPMLTSALICLVTGLVLGWGTKWGLIRYWWVLVKLVLNVILCTLILLALRPTMPAAIAYGVTVAAGEPATIDANGLFMPPIVSLTALSLATVLSVYKPWGRIRRARTGLAAPRSRRRDALPRG